MLKERINTYGNEELQVNVNKLDVLIKGIGSALQAITNKIDEIVERVTTLETQHVILDERVTALEQRESHTEGKVQDLRKMSVKIDATKG